MRLALQRTMKNIEVTFMILRIILSLSDQRGSSKDRGVHQKDD